jgi:hypothetical protein
MIKLNHKIQMPKSQKLQKLSVKCGTMLINPLKIDLKKIIKKTNKLLLKKKPNTLKNMVKLKRKRKENTTNNDQ